MTLTKLLIYVGILAVVNTALIEFVFKTRKKLLFTFLQSFCGVLFVFSGWVKAVDPLGTAYKMEQYFAAFESTFSETWFSFLAPLFPFLSEYATGFSVFMIVFEIVLGILLLMGSRSKFTSWAFLLLVGFFTFLTGYTYLTGYVPEGVNFFSFGSWGAFNENNMQVTDCGCFGDFIKLKPYTSFLKDVFLLIPAFFFIFASKGDKQTEDNAQRAILIGIAVAGSLAIILFNDYPIGWGGLLAGVGLVAAQMAGKKPSIWISSVVVLIYCLSNFVWDIPTADFRPFKEGVNIREQKTAEEDAMGNAPVEYILTSKESGEVTRLSMNDYLKQFKDFPKEKFEIDQETGEPAIPQTKISEFGIESFEGYDISEEILAEPGYSVMFVCPKFYYTEGSKSIMVNDTVSWIVDTIQVEGLDELQYVRKPDKIVQKETTVVDYIYDASYVQRFTEVANPFAEAAKSANIKVFGVVGGVGEAAIRDFQEDAGAKYPIYMADDILLKTIIRSNPGIVLLKDGAVVKKWHVKKLPPFSEVQANFIK